MFDASYQEMEDAYNSFKEYNEYYMYDHMHLIKLADNRIIDSLPVNVHSIINNIRQYLNLDNYCDYINFYHTDYYWGVQIYDLLNECIDMTNNDCSNIDIRCYYLFWEQKYILLNAIGYLSEHFSFEYPIDKFHEIENLALQILNIIIKCNYIQNFNKQDKIKKLLGKIYCLEKQALNDILNLLISSTNR